MTLIAILAQAATNAVSAPPATFLSSEAWNAINTVAAAVIAILGWISHTRSAARSQANATAIQAVHAVAVSDQPTTNELAAADVAVAKLPLQPPSKP